MADEENLIQKLKIGISGLALLSSISLCSQNQKFQKENLETKTINYSAEDTLKEYESKHILSKRKEFVENARKYLGTKYQFGGRATKKNPGIDCLGLIFLPYAKTFNKKWTEISVNPSEIIKKEQLGKPVKNLDGILAEKTDTSKLKEGDIIYLLTASEIKDKPLAKINGINYWPWHTGIYSNKKENLFLEASPGYKVIERDFEKVLKENEAIFVTRIY